MIVILTEIRFDGSLLAKVVTGHTVCRYLRSLDLGSGILFIM